MFSMFISALYAAVYIHIWVILVYDAGFCYTYNFISYEFDMFYKAVDSNDNEYTYLFY